MDATDWIGSGPRKANCSACYPTVQGREHWWAELAERSCCVSTANSVPVAVPRKVCPSYCPDSSLPNPLFLQPVWENVYFFPTWGSVKGPGAHLAGRGASQAGEHTNTFHGVGCGQGWMDTNYSPSQRQMRPHSYLFRQRHVWFQWAGLEFRHLSGLHFCFFHEVKILEHKGYV